MKSIDDEKILIQSLLKPDGKDQSVDNIGREYTGLRIDLIKELDKLFLLEPMRASEFEGGSVAFSLQAFSKAAAKSQKTIQIFNWNPLVSGKYLSVYYICKKNQETFVKTFIANLLDNEKSMYLVRRCGLAENLKAVQDGKETAKVGWLDIYHDFFFFIDQTMYDQTKRWFGL